MEAIATTEPTGETIARQAMQTPLQKRVDELRDAMLNVQADCPLRHLFAPGLYYRELCMKAGTKAVTKVHKTQHMFVIAKGALLIWSEQTGVQRVRAPFCGITTPGTRRLLNVIEDTVMFTFHPTDMTDIEELEDFLEAMSRHDYQPARTAPYQVLEQQQKTGLVTGIISLAITGTMAGLSAAGTFNPTSPDLQSSSKAVSDVTATLLPFQRKLQAAAQAGEKITLFMPLQPTTGPMTKVNGVDVPYKSEDWLPGGKYNKTGKAAITPEVHVGTYMTGGKTTYDFTGLGAADVQKKLAESMAQIRLDLSKKYDSQFIDEALKQEKLADPESFAARDRMRELIDEQIHRPANQPVADLLHSQVQNELDAANSGRLDDMMHEALINGGEAALAARGGAAGDTPDFEKESMSGSAGTRRQLAAIGKATGWLSSGQTPEDIAYRREQQNLANLSAEVTGQTPQSQFKTLSGAQEGPTPVVPGQPLPTLPNTNAAAQSAAMQNWNTQLGAQANQTDPWMAGLSTLLGAANTAAGLGWQPLAKN